MHEAAIRVLSWEQVATIRQRFTRLNPYYPEKIGGSVGRLEDENLDAEERQLRCYATSSKRYCLYTLDDQGEPELVKWSEHGLGHLLNPRDPEGEGRVWMRQVWDGIVREALGLPHEEPSWLDRPALSRLTISSPDLLAPFDDLNAGKVWPDRSSPSTSCSSGMCGHSGTRWCRPEPLPARRPIREGRAGVAAAAVGRPLLGIALSHQHDHRDRRGGVARVQTYRDVLENFRHHPEAKSAGPDGRPCGRQTEGLRRVVRSIPELTTHVGKETNRREEVEQGLVQDWDEVQLVSWEPNDYVETSKTAVETNVTVLRTCPSCATPIIGGRQLYCPSACRQRAYRERVQTARIG